MTRESLSKPWDAIPATGPLLRPKAAREYLGGYSKTRFYELVRSGDLPKPIKIGPGGFNAATGIPLAWLQAVIADRASRS